METVKKRLKRIGKEAETISELLFFAGTTVALVILLSDNVVGNPTADLRGDFESAYGAWCGQWLSQCNAALVTPLQLLCAVYDETFVTRTSGGARPNADLVSISNLGVGAVNVTPIVLGEALLSSIYACNGDRTYSTDCAFDTTAIAALVAFDPAQTNGTTLVNDCTTQADWVVNAAVSYNHLYNGCTFPGFSGVYYIGASLILFGITAAYIVQARLNTDKATDIHTIRHLIIYELIVSPILGVLGAAGIVQSTLFFKCFNVFQFLSLFCFSLFILLSTVVLEGLNIRNLRAANALGRELAEELEQENASYGGLLQRKSTSQ